MRLRHLAAFSLLGTLSLLPAVAHAEGPRATDTPPAEEEPNASDPAPAVAPPASKPAALPSALPSAEPPTLPDVTTAEEYQREIETLERRMRDGKSEPDNERQLAAMKRDYDERTHVRSAPILGLGALTVLVGVGGSVFGVLVMAFGADQPKGSNFDGAGIVGMGLGIFAAGIGVTVAGAYITAYVLVQVVPEGDADGIVAVEQVDELVVERAEVALR